MNYGTNLPTNAAFKHLFFTVLSPFVVPQRSITNKVLKGQQKTVIFISTTWEISNKQNEKYTSPHCEQK